MIGSDCMDELLPLFTWIKTKDGVTGTIVERFIKPAGYLAEYYPHEQNVDDDTFDVLPADIVEYRKP